MKIGKLTIAMHLREGLTRKALGNGEEVAQKLRGLVAKSPTPLEARPNHIGFLEYL